MTEQQGDVLLYQTTDEGDINVTDGIVEMSSGLETAVYLSLFGGNDDGTDYWANIVEPDPLKRYTSETQQLIETLPATSANLLRLEQAAGRDIAWMVTAGAASSVDVTATIPALNTVKLTINILAEGDESEFEYYENWAAAISNIEVIEKPGPVSFNVGAAVRQTAATTTENLQNAVYVDFITVTVGSNGSIQTSTDRGVTWVLQTAAGGYTQTFNAITFGNGIFVAVGDGGAIQTSPDGVVWTVQTPDVLYSGRFRGVSFGNGLFLAVGETGEIQTSPDGVVWTAQTSDGVLTSIFYGATYGNGLYAICGQGGEIQTSPDGVVWTSRTAAGGFVNTFREIAYGIGLFVVVGELGEIQTSPDGVVWTAQTAGSGYTGDFTEVVFGSKTFMAVGESAEMQITYDGFSWSKKEPAVGYTNTFRGVAYDTNDDNTVIIIVGTDSEIQTITSNTIL